MNEEKTFPKRKALRWHNFDYNTNGAYFVTICTKDRRQILSRIVGVDVLGDPKNTKLLSHGRIADKYINQLNDFYDEINVDQYVIMPNHIHFLLVLYDNGSPRTSTPTRQTSSISHFISTFKRFCNKEYGENIWQRGFFDHVIRSQNDYIETKKYIQENPINWLYDEMYSE